MRAIYLLQFLICLQFFSLLQTSQIDQVSGVEYLFVDGNTPAKFEHAFGCAYEFLNRRLPFGKKRCLQIDVGAFANQEDLRYQRYKDLLNNVSIGDNFDLSLHRESHFFIITEKIKQAN